MTRVRRAFTAAGRTLFADGEPIAVCPTDEIARALGYCLAHGVVTASVPEDPEFANAQATLGVER